MSHPNLSLSWLLVGKCAERIAEKCFILGRDKIVLILYWYNVKGIVMSWDSLAVFTFFDVQRVKLLVEKLFVVFLQFERYVWGTGVIVWQRAASFCVYCKTFKEFSLWWWVETKWERNGSPSYINFFNTFHTCIFIQEYIPRGIEYK